MTATTSWLVAELNLPGEWVYDALCATYPAEWWWDGEHLPTAASICARCPVQSQCLIYALGNREASGLWGGRWFHTRTDRPRAPRNLVARTA